MESPKSRNVKKTEKPVYRDFLNRLHVLIAPGGGKKDPTTETLKHIKRGYQGKIENDHIEEVCKYLALWEHFQKLSLRIALAISTGNHTLLMGKLFKNIKAEMASRAQFPKDKIPLFTNVSDRERLRILQNWIDSIHRSSTFNLTWAQNAIICLLNERMTEDDFLAVHFIVDCCFGKTKNPLPKKAASKGDVVIGNRYGDYIKLVASLFITGKATKSKASFGLDMSRFFIGRSHRLENENIELQDVQASLKSDLKVCHDRINEKDNTIKRLADDNDMLNAEIQVKNKALSGEAERYKLLDKHWQEKCSHELARQSFNFKKYFAFEIKEALLSLNTEHPDIAMALNRIRHMEEYIQDMEKANERK